MSESVQSFLNILGVMSCGMSIGAAWVAAIVSPNCSFDKLTGARADGHVRELIHRTSPQLGFLMIVAGALLLSGASPIAGIVSLVSAFGFYATRMLLAPKEGKNAPGVRTKRKEQRSTSVSLFLMFAVTAIAAAVLGLFGV